MEIKEKTEVAELSNQTEVVKVEPIKDAIGFLQSYQGIKKVAVPLIVEGTLVHEGIEFEVSLTDYNTFINLTQGQKASVTSAATTLLSRTVKPDHKTLFQEAIKVPGLLEFFMSNVMPQVGPEVKSALD